MARSRYGIVGLSDTGKNTALGVGGFAAGLIGLSTYVQTRTPSSGGMAPGARQAVIGAFVLGAVGLALASSVRSPRLRAGVRGFSAGLLVAAPTAAFMPGITAKLDASKGWH